MDTNKETKCDKVAATFLFIAAIGLLYAFCILLK